jgi:TldD protein
MRTLAERALWTAQVRGASYADVRIVRREEERITVKNGAVVAASHEVSLGFGVRVIADGAWGFAASSTLTAEEADRVAALAVQIAKASAMVPSRDPVRLAPCVPATARYVSPYRKDPFAVPLEEKVDLLMRADAEMRRVKGIAVAEGNLVAFREEKTFASSEGSYIEQVLTETGAGIQATAVKEGEVQNRSFPTSFGRQQLQKGYELVEELDLVAHAGPTAEEAVALLSAPQCPAMVTTVILEGSQLALQIHESCGHPTELDRVLGTEASYAGTSFLTLDKMGSFRYGSPLVNIVADATVPEGLGSFAYDDEGVPGQRVYLVKEGRFVGYQSSRETAAVLGQSSSGGMRADGWANLPIIRMTNINLEPGEWELDDLIADTDEGLYLATNRSWSIDDRRLNFQFGTEIAYEIRHGKLGRLYKNATYTGITPEFWGRCDAICNARHFQMWGTPNCGKGEPPQTAHVGHGCAPARFRQVQVGVMRE